MPAAFTLYGQLIADTDGFEKSLRDAETRLKGTDAALNKTISASNRLGDTSATVARRYDKLNDGITLQRVRLTEAAEAYLKGEIGARKYANVLASVETQTRSLNSRLADAKARVTELNETGLTHFQNQIQGAVDKSHSLINLNAARPLQGLGPVLQGLGTRQIGLDETILNILIVAAREAGILKVAQEGTAAASAAAAAAETQFSAAAKSAASSQALVAAESEATASAMTEASGATTLFGASLISVGALLAAGVVSILSAKKLSEDVLASAEKRLKAEEAITAEYNKQNQAIAALKPRLANEANDRAFARFVKSDDIFGLQFAKSNLQRERDSISKALTDDFNERSRLKNALPGSLSDNYEYSNPERPQQLQRLKEIDDQISPLAARIEELRQSSISSVDFYTGVQKRQLEAQKEADKQGAELRKGGQAVLQGQLADELSSIKNNYAIQEALLKQHLSSQQISELTAIRETTKLKNAALQSQINADAKYYTELAKNAATPAEAAKFIAEGNKAVSDATAQMRVNSINAVTDVQEKIKALGKEIKGIFVDTQSDNPFVRIFSEGEDAIKRATEATKGLGSQLQNALLAAVQGKNALAQFGQELSNLLQANDLRSQAKQFSQGYLNENSPQIQAQKAAIDAEQDPNRKAALQRGLEQIQNQQTQSDLQGKLDTIANLHGNIVGYKNIITGLASGGRLPQSVLTALQPRYDISDEKLQGLKDREIIAATQGLDPARLTKQQNQIAADARAREADRLEKQRQEGLDALKANTDALKALLQQGGLAVRVTNESDRATVTRQPTRAAGNERFAR